MAVIIINLNAHTTKSSLVEKVTKAFLKRDTIVVKSMGLMADWSPYEGLRYAVPNQEMYVAEADGKVVDPCQSAMDLLELFVFEDLDRPKTGRVGYGIPMSDDSTAESSIPRVC